MGFDWRWWREDEKVGVDLEAEFEGKGEEGWWLTGHFDLGVRVKQYAVLMVRFKHLVDVDLDEQLAGREKTTGD